MTILPAGLTGTDAASSVPADLTGELYGGTTKPVILLYLASDDEQPVAGLLGCPVDSPDGFD